MSSSILSHAASLSLMDGGGAVANDVGGGRELCEGAGGGRGGGGELWGGEFGAVSAGGEDGRRGAA